MSEMMRAKMFEGQLWVLAEDAQKAITEALNCQAERKPTSPNQALYDQGIWPKQQRQPTFAHGALFDPAIFAESQDGKPEQRRPCSDDAIRQTMEYWREKYGRPIDAWCGPNYSWMAI